MMMAKSTEILTKSTQLLLDVLKLNVGQWHSKANGIHFWWCSNWS